MQPPPIFEERVYPFSSTHAKLEEVYMSVFIIIIFFIGVCVCVLVGQRVSVREMYFLSCCCYLFLGELKSNGQAHAPPLFVDDAVRKQRPVVFRTSVRLL